MLSALRSVKLLTATVLIVICFAWIARLAAFIEGDSQLQMASVYWIANVSGVARPLQTMSNVLFVAAIVYGFLRVPRSLMLPFVVGVTLAGTSGALSFAASIVMALINAAAAMPTTFVVLLGISQLLSWKAINQVGVLLGLDMDGDGDVDPYDLLILASRTRVGVKIGLPTLLRKLSASTGHQQHPAAASGAGDSGASSAMQRLQAKCELLEELLDKQRAETKGEYARGYKDGIAHHFERKRRVLEPAMTNPSCLLNNRVMDMHTVN